MGELSGFFNAEEIKEGGVVVGYDRTYDAKAFADYFANFISNGVFINPTDQLKVVAKSGMTLTVKAGKAFIDGFWYELEEDTDITISTNTSSYAVKVAICVRLSLSDRKIVLVVKNAAESYLPTNNGTIHELVLATLENTVGQTQITNAQITDRRTDETYCGFVHALVETIETKELFLQFETAFNSWFSTIQGILGEDEAANLLALINENKTAIEANKTSIENLPVIRSGTAEPDDSVGKDGDIYIKILQ